MTPDDNYARSTYRSQMTETWSVNRSMTPCPASKTGANDYRVSGIP